MTDIGETEKKQWETPEIHVISGLDSCVEFLYGNDGIGIGDDGPPPGFGG